MSKWRKTFRFKLYSVFIISTIVPIVMAAIFFSMYYNVSLVKSERKNMNAVLESITKNVEIQFSELKKFGNIYYMQKEVFQEVEGLNNPKLNENYDDLVKKKLENNYSMIVIKMLYTTKQEVCDVVFFPIRSEEENAYYVGKDYSGIKMIHADDYADEEWFKKAVEADGVPVFYENHVPEYRKGKSYEEVISCVRAIKSMDSKKIIGVAKIDASVSTLENIVDVFKEGERDNIVITEGTKLLAAANKEAEFEKIEQKDGFRFVDKKLYYVESIEIPETDWQLSYFFSMHETLKSLMVVLLVVCGLIVVSVATAFMIYKRYTRETVDDMENITEVLHEIQKGNLEVRAEVKSGNELHDVAVAINKMAYNLNEYIEKEYIWVIRQQRAEYQALQAQINPHFLYNTLNGFIALNRMGETKKLEKSIISLTYLFRYICSGSDETTIEKECTFLKEYLELEKVKYEERLEYMIWVDDACKEEKIPRLLLQPVVENCIVHGMGDTDVPIMITVMARKVVTKGIGEVTVITVRDNGVGFDERTFEDGKEHVGVDNVKTRAEMYWKDSICQCSSTPGEGTKTTIVFGSEIRGEELW